VLVFALCAVGLTAGGSSAAAGPGGYFLDDIGNFKSPIYVDDDGVNDDLLFVVEQAGKIRVLRDGNKLNKPFLDIRDFVRYGGEQGLLSVAFDSNYAANGRFYVYYVNNNGDIRIDQFIRKKATRAKASSRQKVILVPHTQAANHNGGQLQIGPDGDLYASIGDGGPQGDPENDAQDTGSLLGKILRISPLPDGGYDVPAGNPFVGIAGEDEIFALGLRNPWRFSFDAGNGALTVGDVGGSDWEEVDYEADGGLGSNFGWNDYEGMHQTSFGDPPLASPHSPPIHEYANDGATCAITGGYVVRDPDLPDLLGQYLFGDFCEAELRAIQIPGGAPGFDLGLGTASLSSFGEGVAGQIYVVSLDGDVFALEPNTPKRKAQPAHGSGGVDKELVAEGLAAPIYSVAAPGVAGYVYVVERGGTVQAVDPTNGNAAEFLDISGRVSTAGEGGLLSIAFDPDYQANDLVYAYYTRDSSHEIVIEEFTAPTDTDADETSGRKVLTIPHPGAQNHQGGTIAFGPDDRLYAAPGDGGEGGDPDESAQDRGELTGKVLRIDPHGAGDGDYTVPPGNPFVGKPGRDEVYALGLRNPFRFAFDEPSGRIAIGDVGQYRWEEVDRWPHRPRPEPADARGPLPVLGLLHGQAAQLRAQALRGEGRPQARRLGRSPDLAHARPRSQRVRHLDRDRQALPAGPGALAPRPESG